jgi:hypothetical protein
MSEFYAGVWIGSKFWDDDHDTLDCVEEHIGHLQERMTAARYRRNLIRPISNEFLPSLGYVTLLNCVMW